MNAGILNCFDRERIQWRPRTENDCVQESLFFGISFKIHIVIYIYLCPSDKNVRTKYTILHTDRAQHIHNIKKQFHLVL